MREKIIQLIFEIAKQPDAFEKIEHYLNDISREDLSENLIQCGILPEMFEHDSSEEKLWSKYSDVVLSHTLNFLGVSSEVLRARGNSADVFGRTKTYSIVGDAKTFRLSRTAKNQKDFKVKALDDWRRNDTYAVLASPLYQYPNRRSQIYAQAIDKNVTLLSYVHLKFLLDSYANQDLTVLWETGKRLKKVVKAADIQNSQAYWTEIDKTVCSLLNKQPDELLSYKKREIVKTKELGNEGIQFWQNKITAYQKLSKEEAVRRLVKAEKIEVKIKTIEKAINQDFSL
jgi:hypothetical protein